MIQNVMQSDRFPTNEKHTHTQILYTMESFELHKQYHA